jgi:hypothetical protein
VSCSDTEVSPEPTQGESQQRNTCTKSTKAVQQGHVPNSGAAGTCAQQQQQGHVLNSSSRDMCPTAVQQGHVPNSSSRDMCPTAVQQGHVLNSSSRDMCPTAAAGTCAQQQYECSGAAKGACNCVLLGAADFKPKSHDNHQKANRVAPTVFLHLTQGHTLIDVSAVATLPRRLAVG